ncbi:MAG: histidine kinase [Propionibacteriaceae bacterium]|nr:histidine kinase [Propionibacteriaceae bacterium]
MSSKVESRRPASILVGVGRWCAVMVLSMQLLLQIPLWLGGRPAVVLVAGIAQIAACATLLWRVRLGLGLALIPMGMTLVFGGLDADDLVNIYAPAAVAAKGRPRQIALVLLVQSGYGAARAARLGNTAEIIPIVMLAVGGLIIGLAFRLLHRKLRQGAARLELLANDVAEIRAGERLRLASELRTLVGVRLVEARRVQARAQRTAPASMHDALEAVRVACLDAVTRVRGLVGMLREEPLADGSDESLAAPSVTELLQTSTERLRADGIAVELIVAPEVDEGNQVTQLTISRLVDVVRAIARSERPERVRLVTACPAGATVVEAEFVGVFASPETWSPELDGLRERVQTLGGTLKLTDTGEGQRVTMILSEALRVAAPKTKGARERRAWLNWLGVPLMLMAVADLALWMLTQQVPVWSLFWEILGCLAIVVLYFWPKIGAAPAVAALVGMVLTPGAPPIVLCALILAGAWQITKLRNHRFTAGCGAVVLIGLAGLGVLGRRLSFERAGDVDLILAITMTLVGLVGFTLVHEYRAVKARQTEQANSLMAAVEHAQLAERNLLARELHDVVAHHLSVILLQCMAYGDSESPDELRRALDRIADALEAAEAELKLLTSVMADTDDEAAAALVRPSTVADHLLESLRTERFRVNLRIDPRADDLPPITQRTLTRVMQEGVTNMLRYAKRGSQCWIDLSIGRSHVRLTVSNEMPERRRKSQLSLGYGLTGIRERVDLSGGKFRAGPDDGHWVVEVELPLSEHEAETVGGPSAYMR